MCPPGPKISMLNHGPSCPCGPRCAAPAAAAAAGWRWVGGGGGVTWVLGCRRPAEQRGHLLIRHALLLSHTHGLAEVGSQDVFALQENNNTDTDS